MPSWVFQDRTEAGQALAALLDGYTGRGEITVLALPRGGVPVAAPVAESLDAPLDILAARKLGVPGHEELAMGAVAAGGVRVLNDEVVFHLGIDGAVIDEVTRQEQQNLQDQERRFRGGRRAAPRTGRLVILVDDGLATGATMHASIASCRGATVARLVVAVPVGAPPTVAHLGSLVDDVVCPYQPERFRAVGSAYRDFTPVADEEVVDLLARAWRRRPW